MKTAGDEEQKCPDQHWWAIKELQTELWGELIGKVQWKEGKKKVNLRIWGTQGDYAGQVVGMMISEVFSNFNDSVIVWLKARRSSQSRCEGTEGTPGWVPAAGQEKSQVLGLAGDVRPYRMSLTHTAARDRVLFKAFVHHLGGDGFRTALARVLLRE